MRVAFFGGSFDPPHLGHLQIALTAMARLRLDRVLLAPAGRQPLKRQEAAAFADRMAMLRLLTKGHPGLEASECDAPLGGALLGADADARPNYTVDTLARLRPALLSSLARGGAELSSENRGSAESYRAKGKSAESCAAETHGADKMEKPDTGNTWKPGKPGVTGNQEKPRELDEAEETEKPGERGGSVLGRVGEPDEQGHADAVGGLGQAGAVGEQGRAGGRGQGSRLELYFLAGADSFLTLPQWHRPEDLLRGAAAGGYLDGWILAARPGFSLEALGGALPAGYRLEAEGEQGKVDAACAPGGLAGPVVRRQVWLPGEMDGTGGKGARGVPGTRLYLLPDLEDPSTATSIREALQEGRAAVHLQPEISQYIRDHGLYRMLG